MYIFLAYSAVHLFDVYCCVVHFLACSVMLCICLACSVMPCNVLACSVVLCISFEVQCCAVHFLACRQCCVTTYPYITRATTRYYRTSACTSSSHSIDAVCVYMCMCICMYMSM